MLARIPDSSSRIPDSSSDQRTGYDPSFVGPPIEPPAPRGRRRSRGRITRRARHDFPWHSVEADNCAGGWRATSMDRACPTPMIPMQLVGTASNSFSTPALTRTCKPTIRCTRETASRRAGLSTCSSWRR